MAQKEIEIILMRQLASYLAMPVFLVDPNGTLLFYNEPAEAILGQRFDETGEMPAVEWANTYAVTDEAGQPIPIEELPLIAALLTSRPTHGRLAIRGLDNVQRTVEVMALPLVGQAGRTLGAVAVFCEVPNSCG